MKLLTKSLHQVPADYASTSCGSHVGSVSLPSGDGDSRFMNAGKPKHCSQTERGCLGACPRCHGGHSFVSTLGSHPAGKMCPCWVASPSVRTWHILAHCLVNSIAYRHTHCHVIQLHCIQSYSIRQKELPSELSRLKVLADEQHHFAMPEQPRPRRTDTECEPAAAILSGLS